MSQRGTVNNLKRPGQRTRTGPLPDSFPVFVSTYLPKMQKMQDCLSAPTAHDTWLLPVLQNCFYNLPRTHPAPLLLMLKLCYLLWVKTSRFFSLMWLVTFHVAHNRVAGANTISTWEPVSSTGTHRSEKSKSLPESLSKAFQGSLSLSSENEKDWNGSSHSPSA